jgi:hypothetical protein
VLTKRTSKARAGPRAVANAAVHRAMRQQSLRAPWRHFSDACTEMVQWRSFALWVRAIIDAERGLPDWLREHIDERCPGFVVNRTKPVAYDSIWVDLSAWADEHVFDAARCGGWLEALHFYSGRDPRSEQVWNQWTRVESAWRACRPHAYPSFDKWHREALSNCAAAEEGAAAHVKEYIEWEAFAFWTRLIAESAGEMPTGLVSVLDRRCPGFVESLPGKSDMRAGFSTRLWRDLLAWIEGRHFAPPDLDAVRAAARTHIRGERIAAYWAYCSSRWKAKPPSPYPEFDEWLREADAFVTK